MAIKFKPVGRVEPGVAGGGVRKFYINPVHSGELTLEAMSKGIKKASTAGGGDVLVVLRGLVDEAVEGLSKGKIVRLGEFGSFRITFKSEGRDTPEQVTPMALKGLGIIFTPGKKLRDMMKTATLTKA